MPEFKTNLEELIFWDVRALNEVIESLLSIALQIINVWVLLHGVSRLFNQAQVLRKY
jgi:hypothetical protein